MAKILILAEKPSIGRELARVLGCRRGGNGYIEGDKYIVTWALGHLVTLCDPDHYNPQWKHWSIETLPMLPSKMELTVIKSTAKQYHVVKDLLRKTNELIVATDAGREGELVARWIMQKVGFRGNAKRLWISSQTDRAIKEGFANLRPLKEYNNLYDAAVARSEADWMVGLNVTRALSCKYNAQLSAGRVQTPTLALIVRREEEIRKFIPKDYYTLQIKFDGFYATWRDKNNNPRMFDKSSAENLMIKVKGQKCTIAKTEKVPQREAPPLLYDLTELQRDANIRYGYTAKQTLNVMQRLYENYKVLTYPRTDSRYISDDIVSTLPERLKSIAIGPYAEVARNLIRTRAAMDKKCVNNAKVSDHHAIIPTEENVNLTKLSTEERMVYDLVVRRFMAVFCGSAQYEKMNITVQCENERFYASGKRMITSGWHAAYDKVIQMEEDEADEKEQHLPALANGQALPQRDVQIINGQTSPPKRYTEASLLSAMEKPGKFIEDKQMRDVIGRSGGLGTPATRAEIIERLFDAFYIERKGKILYPTSKGQQLISLVPDDLKEPMLTAKWETTLDSIRLGKASMPEFVKEIRRYSSSLVQTVVLSEKKYAHDNATRTPCPVCGKYLLDVNGKKGKMLVCSDRECGYRQNVSFISNARCPNCKKKLSIFGEGEKRKYICPCGFRDSVDGFHKKNSNSGGKTSKFEVQKYLKQQNEKPEVSAFELALQKAMDKKK